MARHIFIPDPARLGVGSNGRPDVYCLRELLRNGDGLGYGLINNPLDSSRWKISDIVYWVVSSQEKGYCFLARDTDRNIEYAFFFPGMDSANNAAELGDIASWDGTEVVVISTVQPDASSLTSYPTMCVIFQNIDYATSSWGRNWGFDDATEMTFTGGDWENLTSVTLPTNSSDWSNEWVPTGVDNPRGISIWAGAGVGGVSSDNEEGGMAIVIDDASDAVAGYGFDLQDISSLGVGIISKNLFVNVTSGDTYTQGTMRVIASVSTNFFQENYLDASGFDNAGNQILDYTLYKEENLNRNNYKVNGLVKWRSLPAISPTFDKGWINSDLAASVGAYQIFRTHRQLFALPDASNPMCKYFAGVATMWVPNVPAIPFFWPGYGEGPTE